MGAERAGARVEEVNGLRTQEFSIASYDGAEQRAKEALPNEVVMAFAPLFFERIGYPVRVRSEPELSKYIDVMHELRFERDFTTLLGGGLTQDEFTLLRRLTTLLCAFTDAHFGQKAVARSSVLRSLHVLRQIRWLWGTRRPRVLEIGPGCGYLGALLMLEGYPYAAVEVTQAFYLYQHRWWTTVTDGGLVECTAAVPLADLQPGAPWHIPWWVFAELEPAQLPPFDVVTCNHALGEMHPNALRHTLRLASASQRQGSGPTAVVIDGFYGTSLNPMEELMESLYRFGYVLVHHDPAITLFALAGTPEAAGALSLPRVPPRRWRRAIRALAGAITNAPRCTERQERWGFRIAHPGQRAAGYVAPRNPLAHALLAGREGILRAGLVPIERVREVHRELLGHTDYESPSERFLRALQR